MKRKCPHCNKIIESLYVAQLDYNFKAHLLACKKKKGNHPGDKLKAESPGSSHSKTGGKNNGKERIRK